MKLIPKDESTQLQILKFEEALEIKREDRTGEGGQEEWKSGG